MCQYNTQTLVQNQTVKMAEGNSKNFTFWEQGQIYNTVMVSVVKNLNEMKYMKVEMLMNCVKRRAYSDMAYYVLQQNAAFC